MNTKYNSEIIMHLIEQAKSLLDFNQKLDIGLLDGVVNIMYTEHGDIVSSLFVMFISLDIIFFL